MEPSLLVIHYISLPAGCFGSGCVEQLFTGCLDCRRPGLEDLEGLKVSTHFFIDRKGELTQFVPCDQRAWHAGVSVFEGRERCNDFSLGVELEGSGQVPFEDAQYQTLIKLARELAAVYPLEAVAGHEHIAPGRKADPGPFFDWNRLQAALPKLKHPCRTL